MREIPGDSDLERKTLECYQVLNRGKQQIKADYGHVAESLVQSYYHCPIKLSTKGDDGGVDLVMWNRRIDVKNHCTQEKYFESGANNGVIDAYHGLRADIYLFTEIDIEKKKIVLIGYMTKADIQNNCKFIKKGEMMGNQYYQGVSNADCYQVKFTDIEDLIM